jgi:hypothetical protein
MWIEKDDWYVYDYNKWNVGRLDLLYILIYM